MRLKSWGLPMGMGAMMGTMALWMLHQAQSGTSMLGGVAFVLAHVAAVAIVVVAALLVKRGLGGKTMQRVARIRHRPSLAHVAVMLGTALITALVIHLIHGGPTWT